MKFDFIIGNPPYQDDTLGENKGYAPPVYHIFIEEMYKLADRVELISPARFLFNAGSTPKDWNKKMLSDPHLKVLHYEPNSNLFFQNTEIKGGIAITYHDVNKDFGAIETFTPYDELDLILNKVNTHSGYEPLSNIILNSYVYHFTDQLHIDHPEVKSMLSSGHEYDLKSNIFQRLPHIFKDELPSDGNDYVIILGREGNDRKNKYIRREYINSVPNLDCYKLFLSRSNGAGLLGETLSPPILGKPGMGATETFFSIGNFHSIEEAQSICKYVKAKFTRLMLGILKTTQDITPEKWKYVPLQDFTSSSDIDWTKSIPEIDQQLYAKYGLDDKEIEFIETRVKEMA